jgi:hypothetical protein
MYKSFLKDNTDNLHNVDKSYYKNLYYTLTMNNIKQNNNILFEGCEAHGLFYSCNYQVINPCCNVIKEDDVFPELQDNKDIVFQEQLSEEIKLLSELTIDNKIKFDNCDNILNIEFIKETGYIKILKTGIYIINLSCQFNEEGEIIICVNDIPDMLSLTKTMTPHNFITIHYVLNLNCDDILSFHNYSLKPLTTAIIDDINTDIDNVCLHIWMISNLKL